MSLFVEFHLIQNFAPSNLNRDDTGAPKDALFGGHRRARVSSQCFKRAMRLKTQELDLIPLENRGIRTKKLAALLKAQLGDEAAPRIETALAAAGLKLKDDGKTEVLLFLGEGEINGLVALIKEHWDELAPAAGSAGAAEKKSKKDAKASAPPEVVKKAKALLNGGKAVDVALFGRMLADMPSVNQEAACQVAHALSTHRVEREFDYFTAVDDQSDDDETGAGMIGQVEFNSATFYRYAVVDAKKLTTNLQNDQELAIQALGAFTQAIARAVPTGKQNSFAAHNPPSFIGVVLRSSSPLNLANAFEKPVWPRQETSLTASSVQALAAYEEKVGSVYGNGQDAWAFVDVSEAWPADKGEAQPNIDALAEWVKQQVARRVGA